MRTEQDLKRILEGDVEHDARALEECEHDASIFEIHPSLVVHPKNAADVCRLVEYVAQHAGGGLSLTPRSGGTDMSGGALTESVVVEMQRYFTSIIDIGDGRAVTQPGVFYRDFEKATLAKGLLLPSYPASREICTVGGMAANNSGGEKSLRYGKTEDYVERLKVVLRDGKEHEFRALTKDELDAKMREDGIEGDIHRRMFALVDGNRELLRRAKPKVSKNSSGYYLWNVWDEEKGIFDLTKLLVGSQGTLGIFTEITYRLIRPEKRSKLLVIYLKDLDALPKVVQAVMAHSPESFESYDDHTFKFAIRYWRDIISFMAARNLLGLVKEFWPEIKMIFRHGFPKQVMLAEFTGDDEADIDRRIDAAMEGLRGLDLGMRRTVTEEDAHKYWVMRRESFNLLRRHFKKRQAAPFIDDFCVLPEHLPEFLPKLYAILDKYDLMITLVGHMGDGNFHVIPLMDVSRPDAKEIIDSLSHEVYDLVFSYGGSMSGEHNDGLIRSPYLKKMFGDEVYALFEETKRIFDPENIFNPGKKVDADLAYALDHLKGRHED